MTDIFRVDDPEHAWIMPALERYCPGLPAHLLQVAEHGIDALIADLLHNLAAELRHNDGLERWVDMLHDQVTAAGGRPDLQIHTGYHPDDPDTLPADYLCGALPVPRSDPIPAQHRPEGTP